MSFKTEKIYPNCPIIIRTVDIGGFTKSQLIDRLKQSSISLNEYGKRLIDDERFMTFEETFCLQTIELTVGNLGFPNGATTSQIYKKANDLGLELCPIELGPYLRLAYLDQPEGSSNHSMQIKQAPSGSITIASKALNEDVDFPKGFYLRRINGVLWLRGYCADHLHIWNDYDHFIFCQPKRA